jgi:short-subunit dehydrogenase
MELKGKTILLTGASSGIGFELARQLAREKIRLALLARRENLLVRLADGLRDSGSEILPITCDVSKRDEIKRAGLRIRSQFGPIHIAILNAGIGHRESGEDYDVEAAREIFAVNVFGLIDFVGELLPDFRRAKSGMIVGVSSLADCRGFPKSGFYSASKTAATFLLESLRVELRGSGIKVVTVKPGFVRTEMVEGSRYPMPFLMPAERAARIIVKGIKKEKRTIQFPRPTVWGSKLLKVMPDFLYERIAARIKK